MKECYQHDEEECFCFCPSTCSGQNWHLGAFTVTVETLTEQELRLVTNFTKLGAANNVTQQDLALWLVAIMLGLPSGSSSGHKERRRQLLKTTAEPTTHPWAPWGGKMRAQ